MMPRQAKNVMFVGDMHCKQKAILPYVSKAAEVNDVDQIVFMGDYVDDYVSPDEEMLDALKYQIKWCKQESKNKSIVNLAGNHDFSYLASNDEAKYYCSGHRDEIKQSIRALLEKLSLQAAYQWNGIIATHSGVAKDWLNFCGMPDDCESVEQCINSMLDQRDSRLYMASSYRGGCDKCSGPLWLDIHEMSPQTAPSFNQVMSHTPVKKVEMHEFKDAGFAFCVDSFSTSRQGLAVGDGSLLLITASNNQVKSHRCIIPEYVGFESWSLMCKKHRDAMIMKSIGCEFEKDGAWWL